MTTTFPTSPPPHFAGQNYPRQHSIPPSIPHHMTIFPISICLGISKQCGDSELGVDGSIFQASHLPPPPPLLNPSYHCAQERSGIITRIILQYRGICRGLMAITITIPRYYYGLFSQKTKSFGGRRPHKKVSGGAWGQGTFFPFPVAPLERHMLHPEPQICPGLG